jgi:pimeloyl-ACP methyl ester carboxylesterase
LSRCSGISVKDDHSRFATPGRTKHSPYALAPVTTADLPSPTGTVELDGGRRLAFDDVGDPSGAPVLYLHGFPDSRLSRHPDDHLAAAAGVRLLSVDRPGFGASDPSPAADYAELAADVLALPSALGLHRFSVLGWSSGGPLALALAAVAPGMVAAVGLAAGNPPLEADSDVIGAMDEILALRGEVVADLGADGFAHAVAPVAAAADLDLETAREMVVEGRDEHYLGDLAAVPGLTDQLALGAVLGTSAGLDGAVDDLRRQVSPWGFPLTEVAAPVWLWYGTHDTMFRPRVGRWLAERLPDGHLVEVEDGSHLAHFTRWREVLEALAGPLRPG